MNTDNKSPEPLANLSDIDQAILMGASGSVSSEQVVVPEHDVTFQGHRITAHIPVRRIREGFFPATVNWSGIGSVCPADAREFARDILAAADLADAWNAAVLPSNTGDQP